MKSRIIVALFMLLFLSGTICQAAAPRLPIDFDEGTIFIIQPLKNTVWLLGSTQKITWKSSGFTGQWVNITLTRHYKYVQTIATHIDITQNEFLWVIPATIEKGKDYTIKLQSMTRPMCYDFSYDFELDASQK